MVLNAILLEIAWKFWMLSFQALARNLLQGGVQISPRGIYPAVSHRRARGTNGEPCRRTRRNDKNKKVWTCKPQFSGSLLVVLGSGLLVVAGCRPLPSTHDGLEQPSVPSPLASATLAVIKETETAIAPPTENFPAPTSSQTANPSPHSATTPFEEPFDDNRNNWFTDSTLVTITSGTYDHLIECPESNVSPHCGRFVKIPLTFPRNFRMEIDATLIKSSPGASVIVAFEVRRKAEYYYIEYSITEGRYQISRISEFGIVSILPETSTDLLKTTVGELNQIGIEVINTSLTPLVNGQALAPSFDGKIPVAGDSYLVLLIARGHSAEMQFDNLLVQEVK